MFPARSSPWQTLSTSRGTEPQIRPCTRGLGNICEGRLRPTFHTPGGPSATLSSVILTLFCSTNQAYIMGILFLLAGYFTPASVERKGYARFVSDRFLRLGLPCSPSA
jgi:hypothetical protein